jgi:hypothetical protein
LFNRLLGDPHEVSAADDEAATLALAQERDRQIESGQVQPLSHDELMTRSRW